MATDAEQRIAALRQAVIAASQQRARAEAQRDQLAETERRTLTTMQEQFGVTDAATAQAKLAEMDQELNQLYAAAEAALARATAP